MTHRDSEPGTRSRATTARAVLSPSAEVRSALAMMSGARTVRSASAARTSQSTTAPSEPAESTWSSAPWAPKDAARQKATEATPPWWPRSCCSWRPLRRPCVRTEPSAPPVASEVPSRDQATHVTAPPCALANLRAQAPVDRRQTLRQPSRSPEASAVPSGEHRSASTGESCMRSSSSRWYGRSVRRRHVAGSQTSTKPSLEPVISARPSGEKQAARGRAPSPRRTPPADRRGGFSGSAGALTAPRKTSTRPRWRRSPFMARQRSAWPRSVVRRAGATSPSAASRDAATAPRRSSLDVPGHHSARSPS
mmetsp:Transcript_16364/g.48841  ORF Transcript_16364/g.48841 Transcript_16364/m.48841 type:complete len:308 (+) Transcript_16364:365-1288(+)